MSSSKPRQLGKLSKLTLLSLTRRLQTRRVLFLLLLPSVIFTFFFTSFYDQAVVLWKRDPSVSSAPPSEQKAVPRPPGIPEQGLQQAVLVPTKSEGVEQKCVLPSLQVDDKLMMSFVKKPAPLSCPAHLPDWVYVRNGTLFYSEDVRTKVGNFSCDFSPLVRTRGDERISWGKRIQNFPSGSPIPADYFKIECSKLVSHTSVNASLGNSRQLPPQGVAGPDYTEVLMGVSPLNTAVRDRIRNKKPQANGLSGLSVVMMGFDSMSRMSWLRRMSASREYLLQLGGIELEGYNIMGDGTPAALFPILTGKHEQELPEARRGRPKAKPVDAYPWIWKDFADVGYVTSWADSEVTIAPFNYRLLGFYDPPTDYFMRPYYLGIRSQQGTLKHQKGCRGPEPKHRAWFNWARDLHLMYGNSPKFLMHFYATLSHDDNNQITKSDEDLKQYIQELETGGYLNSTILVIFGDHGARYTNVRQTWAGKLEERLPYMAFRFPSWFEGKYPQLMRNFRTNAHRLTMPMDIHETLHDVIKFDGAGKGDLRSRGISLFKEIPIERECAQADISSHWCACLNWKPIKNPEQDAGGKQAVRTAVDFINAQTEPHRNLCAKLEVKNVSHGESLQANDEFLSFNKAVDSDGRRPLFDPRAKANIKEPVVLYQMTFITQPGGGHFEVTVTKKGSANWTITDKEISRINAYGNDPACILGINRQLRQFCYCA